MKNKKHINTLIMLLFILITLTQTSCDGSERSSLNRAGDTEHEELAATRAPEDEKGQIWEQIGPVNASINQIQVAADGSVFVLSEGKLYLLQNKGFLEMGPQDEITLFYLMESRGERILFAAAKGGGIYAKKGDGTWNKTESPGIQGQPVGAIASDNRRGIVYVGQSTKSGGGLWKSTDEGKSWEKLTEITVRTVVVHPQIEEYLYIVDKAAFLSGDGGKHWEKFDTPANYGLLIHPQDSEDLYLAYAKGVVVAESSGTVKNTNNFKLPGVMTCLELNFSRPGEWVLSMWDYPSGCGALYFSFDKGSTWKKHDETMDKMRILDMRFNQKGDKLYLGTAGHGLWILNLQMIR